jgi:hypothetical protein
LFTAANFMDPGEVPEELQGLNFIETQLIARVSPVVSLFRIKGHQFGYRGNVISFPQDVHELARTLPRRIEDLTSVIAVRMEDAAGHVDFRVRAGMVRRALVWLCENNEFYRDVEVIVAVSSEHSFQRCKISLIFLSSVTKLFPQRA